MDFDVESHIGATIGHDWGTRFRDQNMSVFGALVKAAHLFGYEVAVDAELHADHNATNGENNHNEILEWEESTDDEENEEDYFEYYDEPNVNNFDYAPISDLRVVLPYEGHSFLYGTDASVLGPLQMRSDTLERFKIDRACNIQQLLKGGYLNQNRELAVQIRDLILHFLQGNRQILRLIKGKVGTASPRFMRYKIHVSDNSLLQLDVDFEQKPIGIKATLLDEKEDEEPLRFTLDESGLQSPNYDSESDEDEHEEEHEAMDPWVIPLVAALALTSIVIVMFVLMCFFVYCDAFDHWDDKAQSDKEILHKDASLEKLRKGEKIEALEVRVSLQPVAGPKDTKSRRKEAGSSEESDHIQIQEHDSLPTYGTRDKKAYQLPRKLIKRRSAQKFQKKCWNRFDASSKTAPYESAAKRRQSCDAYPYFHTAWERRMQRWSSDTHK
ncbi:unnamed protein product [Cyprideis torosa]|uniref:Uncharacterized protein n=1 Tax=Cyprideis torosa TaxID=163714 RepID=A0A7R8W9N6_9CRUS|nr:unnamed protein product [Cyprideis torosa]CAG0889969.1 unnamed protein product [Cyprideis torosa]